MISLQSFGITSLQQKSEHGTHQKNRMSCGRSHYLAVPQNQTFLPQQFLYFLPLPHGHGSFRPTD